jgi:N-acyl-L-homoserine lactone synthetase
MSNKNMIFFSFPGDYEKPLKKQIMDAFRVGGIETIEKKGFDQFMDLLIALPETVVISIGPGVSVRAIFEILRGESSEKIKVKLLQEFSGRPTKVLFIIPFGMNELNVEINIKRDQLDFLFDHISELIDQYENAASMKNYKKGSFWVIAGDGWKEIRADQYNNNVFAPLKTDTERQEKLLRQTSIKENPYSVVVIDQTDQVEYEKMLKLRQRVYDQELHWFPDKTDQYDHEDSVYLIVYDEEKEQVGSLRILKSDRPWMIEKEFKPLLGKDKVDKAGAIEITRLFISTEKRHLRESLWANVRLFRGIYQWMTANQFSTIYMVVRPEYFKFFEMEGLCPARLGHGVDASDFDGAVAGRIDLETTMPYLKEHMYDLWQWITNKEEPVK